MQWPRVSRGFSLIESILASALFGLIVTGMVGPLIYSPESVELSGRRNRATFLAAEGLQAAQNIRDQDFSLLSDGPHGLAISGNQWVLSGTSDSTDDFTRVLTITTLEANAKKVTSTVTWQQTAQRSGTVSLKTHLYNWRTSTAAPQADQVLVNVSSATIGGSGKSEVLGIVLQNTGTTTVMIDRVMVSWTKPNQNIREIKMENVVVWSNNGPGTPTGTQSSGTELNIQDISIPAGENDFDIDRIRMTGNATGDTFTLLLQFIDGSTKQTVFSPPSP